jgi:hypothetical protein
MYALIYAKNIISNSKDKRNFENPTGFKIQFKPEDGILSEQFQFDITLDSI